MCCQPKGIVSNLGSGKTWVKWWVKTPRINPIRRVRVDVEEQIYPTLQSDWIGSYISSCLRIVVSEVIVVEPCFRVVVLARIYSDTSPPKKAFFYPL